MKTRYLSGLHTTRAEGTQPKRVTITHFHHPQFGETVELISVLRGSKSRLLVRMSSGRREFLSKEWTDYGVSPAETPSIPPAGHLLAVDGLRQIIQIVREVSETVTNSDSRNMQSRSDSEGIREGNF